MGITRASCMVLLAIGCTVSNTYSASAGNWPSWRGPLGTGAAKGVCPPIRWSETKNIVWKVPIPGRGSSTPIVWEDRIYITTAIPTYVNSASPDRRGAITPSGVVKYDVIALDRLTGDVVWRRTAAREKPHEGTHKAGTWASHSPIVDGTRLFVFFGSRGLFCYDLKGELLWTTDFGDQRIRNGFGEGSSPSLYGDHIVVNWDHEGDSFVVALDKYSGIERWRRERDERTSWSTPLIADTGGKQQVIISATNLSRAYDLETGADLWESAGMTANVIPSPVYTNGLVYLVSGFRGAALQAVDVTNAAGDITGTDAIVWSYHQDTPYVSSALIYDGKIYFLKSNRGILTCLDARTGEEIYTRQRLEGISSIYSSPVSGNGMIYLTGRDGTTLVIDGGRKFTVVGKNRIDERVDASIALVDDQMFIRGSHSLYCISELLNK